MALNPKVSAAINDPEFLQLTPAERREALAIIDPNEFGSMGAADQDEAVFALSDRQPERKWYDPAVAVAKEIPKGILRGSENLGAIGGGAIKWAGDVTGIDAVSDAGETIRGYYSDKAQEHKGAVSTYKDVNSVEDAALYLAGGAAESVPMFVPGMGGAFLGGKVATAGAIAGLERAAAGGVVDILAPAAAKTITTAATRGTIAGAAAGSYGMELGSIYADQAEQGIEKPWKAAGYAIPAAALDTVGELLILAKIPAFKALQESPLLRTAEGRNWFIRGAKEALKGGSLEGVTEFAQTIIERGGADKEMFNKEAFEEALNGAIIGGFTGGVMSGAGGAMNKPTKPADVPPPAAPPVADTPTDMTTGQPVNPVDPSEPPPPADGGVSDVLSALNNPTEQAIPVNTQPSILDEMLKGTQPVTQETPVTEPVEQPLPVSSEASPVEVPLEIVPENKLTPAAAEAEIVHLTGLSQAAKTEELSLQKKVANGEMTPEQAKAPIKLAQVRAKAADAALKLLDEQKQASIEAATETAVVEDTAAPVTPEVAIKEDTPTLNAEDKPVTIETPVVAPVTALDEAAHVAATSPTNDKVATPAQVEAGNYAKGHVMVHGLDISIENPHGSTRSGTSPDGKKWETTLQDHYGYIKGTVGKDKDHVDVFIKPGTDPAAVSDKVFVVDQVNPGNRSFDEHKALIGYHSPEEAKAAYLRNYDQSGATRIGDITETTASEFKAWLKDGDTSQRFTDAPITDKGGDSDGVQRNEVQPQTGEVGEKGRQEGLLTDQVKFEVADPKRPQAIPFFSFQIGKAADGKYHANYNFNTMTQGQNIGFPTVRPGDGKVGHPTEREALLSAASAARDKIVSLPGDNSKYVRELDKFVNDLPAEKADLPSVGTVSDIVPEKSGAVSAPTLTSDEQADAEMAAALERRRVRKAAEAAATTAPALETFLKPGTATRNANPKASDSSVKGWTQKAEVKGDVIHVTAKLNTRPHELYPDTPDHSFTIPVAEWNKAEQSREPARAKWDLMQKISPLDHLEPVNDRLRDAQVRAIDKAMSPAGTMTVKEQQAAARDRLKKPSTVTAEPKPRTATEAASDAAGHTKTAFDAGVDAINAIFEELGKTGSLGSGPHIDEAAWARIKPHLDKMWTEAKAAYADATEALDAFVDKCIDAMGEKIIPYMTKYYREVKNGDKVEDKKAPTKEAADGKTDGPAIQPDGREDSAGSKPGNEPTRPEGADEPKSGTDAGVDSGLPEGIKPELRDVTSDYVHTDFEKLGHGSPKVKAANNIKAIKIVKDMVATGRLATPAERDALANYVGWGAVSQLFDPARAEWSKEHTELKDLLTQAEWEEAASSTQNAFYTPPALITAAYEALERMGVTGGKIKDSATGVGNWFGLMPEGIKKRSQLFGAERDIITATIAQALYPSATIVNSPYEDVHYANDHFDVSIGNPPFGKTKITDIIDKDLSGLSIHNYFFAKDIKKLRPGGILAQVVSTSLMDKAGELDRERFGKDVKLVGAIRLPNTAFKAGAGTETATDIVFLQKLMPGEAATTAWTGTKIVTGADGNAYPVNEYFAAHPEMVLGDYAPSKKFNKEFVNGVYGGVADVIEKDGVNLADALKVAISKLPANIYTPENRTADMLDPSKAVTPPGETKVWGYFVKDGVVHQRTPDMNGARASEPAMLGGKIPRQMNAGEVARVSGMLGVLDAYRRLQRAELSDEPTGKIELLRKSLNSAYDSFVKTHGYISQASNERVMRGDINDFPNLLALEKDFDKGLSPDSAKKQGVSSRKPSAEKADIFTKRQLVPYHRAEKADTAYDALMIGLAETGRIDIGRMEELTDRPYTELLAELGDIVFKDPDAGTVLADEYLSGNVKQKLARAKEMAKQDPKWQANVNALEKVQPVDKTPDEINVRLGAHWVPEKTYGDFIGHILGGDAVATYVPEVGRFLITYPRGKDSLSSVARQQTYGTDSADATWLLERIFDNRDITIRYEDIDGVKRVDADATMAANQKATEIKNKFDEWLWTDADRRDLVGGEYNAKMNTDVERQWNGQHLITPGKSESIKLHPQQKNVAWRMIQKGKAVMDHAVGAGKTFAIITGAMEMRRMGLSKKPMIAVPNHLVGQWTGDFKRLYPAANVLMISRKDFTAKNRKAFIARIATGDYDAIVIAHSSFGFIPAPVEYEKRFYAEQLQDLEAAIRAAREEAGDKSNPGKSRNPTVKELEAAKDRFLNRLKKLTDKPEDSTADFDHLGVDSLFVDESHEYRTLYYTTRRSQIKGLGNTQGNKKTTDLFVKSQYLLDRNQGRGLFFATGTPISNTMAEVYTIQKYMDYRKLKAMGLHHFDTWANTFGTEVTDWEMNAGGQLKSVNRFKKFVNAPELSGMYREFADVVTLKMLKEQAIAAGGVWPVPKIKGGKRRNIVVERSEEQADFMNWIVGRMENINPKRPDLDNHLWCETHARMAGLDLRILVPDAADLPGSKVNVAVRDIFDIYTEWDAKKGTQLVFCDLSTPKKHKGASLKKEAERKAQAEAAEKEGLAPEIAEVEGDGEADDTERISADDILADELGGSHDFSVYDDMKAKLIARGVKENQIAFIHDYNTDIQKMDLYAKMNAGDVRVLFGSTSKMGAGMNVQKRLVALHHLDAPYMPKDLEQREGRIIRQGNMFYEADPEGFEVTLAAYATKQMYDARMWEINEAKAGYTEQFRAGGITREMDDVVPESVNAAAMKAEAAGNPLIRQEIQLRQKVTELEALERSNQSSRWSLESKARSGARADETHGKEVAAFDKMAQKKVDNPHDVTSDGFNIIVSGTRYEPVPPTDVPAVSEKPTLAEVPEGATKDEKKAIDADNQQAMDAYRAEVHAAKEVKDANIAKVETNKKAAADAVVRQFKLYVDTDMKTSSGQRHFGAYRGFAVYIKHDTKLKYVTDRNGDVGERYTPEISFSLLDPTGDGETRLATSAPYERAADGSFAFSPSGLFTRLDNMVDYITDPQRKAAYDAKRDAAKKEALDAQVELDKPSPHAKALEEARSAHATVLSGLAATGGVNQDLPVEQRDRWDMILHIQRAKKAAKAAAKGAANPNNGSGPAFHSNPFLDPKLIVEELSKLTRTISDAMPKLVELGRIVYAKSGDKINQFLRGMSQHLGPKLYEAFRSMMVNVYRTVRDFNTKMGEKGMIGEDINADDTVNVLASVKEAKAGFVDRIYKAVGKAIEGKAEEGSTIAQAAVTAYDKINYVADKMSPLGHLRNKQGFLASRYLALGKLDEVNSTVKSLYATLSKAESADDQKALYDYFTTKDADINTIVNPEVRATAATVKRQIVAIGDMLVEKGWLKLEKHEETEGSYLPRVYLKHILGAGAFSSFAGGKKLDKGYLKKRQDIPEEVRRIVLGEVTDPAYLAARAVSLPLRDLAIAEWLEQIASDTDNGWVLPNSLVKWKFPDNGKVKKVTPYYLKSEAERLREQSRHMNDADAQEALDLADRMDVAANETLESAGLDPAHIDEVPTGYKKLPNSPRYGALRGMVVQQEIKNDIVGMGEISMGESELMRTITGAATKATGIWKFMKVAANPPAQVRNFVTNMILLHLSGVPLIRVPQRIIQAIQSIKSNGEHWQVAKRMGVRGATFANTEMGRTGDDLKTRLRKPDGASWFYVVRKVMAVAKEWGFHKPGDMYQFMEAIGKTAKIIDMMEREGADAETAGLAAHEALFDYSLVPPAVRVMRMSPLGAPFITFMYKAFPAMLKVAATKPWRLATYWVLMETMAAMVSGMTGVDDDDLDKLKKMLPEWIQEKGHTLLLPHKDKYGRWQVLDLSYFFPWTPFTEIAGELSKGDFMKAAQTTSLFGGPLLSLIQAGATQKDPFTRRPIVLEKSPTNGEIASGWMRYLYRLSAPPFLTDMGLAGKLLDAYRETPDKFGDAKVTPGQAALRAVGVNVVSVDVAKSRRSNIERMKMDIVDLKRELTQEIKNDPKMSAKDRLDTLRHHQQKIAKIREKAKDYITETK